MADVKKNDWFATLLYNPDLSMAEINKLGVTADNSGLQKKEDYRNIPDVIAAFSDANGKFNEKQFNDFYDGALELYNKYANEEYEKQIPVLCEYLDSKWDRPLDKPVFNAEPTFNLKQNAAPDPYGRYYMPSPFEDNRYTPKEIAEQNEVVDYKTGEGLGWTPEDKGGFLKGLIRPTVVLAAYDEDEYDENGKLLHKAGDLKYKDGKPFAETLGDRDIRTKQVIGYSDTFTREGTTWNKYDFFDSDDYDKSLVGTLAKTAVKTIPYFIPGVNTALGAITAAYGLARVMPVIGKAVNSMITGDADNDFGKSMNQIESWVSRFDPTVSQRSQENLITVENLGNLISSISGQLFQQRAVGMIPSLLKGKDTSVETAKLGRNLAFAYMAATSSQDAYNVAKEAGASDRTAGFFMVGNMLALWKLMQIDYFRDNLFKGTYMDESEVRSPLFNVAKETKEALTKNGNKLIVDAESAATKSATGKAINKIRDFYYNTMVGSLEKGGLTARMLSEATEESMEEFTIDLEKALFSGLEAIGVNTTGNDNTLSWNVTPEDILQRYGMAFVGGAIGGGIFAGQQKFEDWLLHNNIQTMETDDMKKILYHVASGHGQEMKDYLKRWHKKGLLGSKNLGSNLTTIQSLDGEKVVAESATGNLSQNDVVYRHLTNLISTFERLVDAEGLKFTSQQAQSLIALNINPTDKTLRAQTLIDLGAYSTLQDELLTLAADIVKKNDELQAAISENTTPGDSAEARQENEKRIKHNKVISDLEDQLKELRKKRDDFLDGKLNYKYINQALFITNPVISSLVAGDLSKENYTRYLHNSNYSTLTDEQRQSIDDEYAEWEKTTGKDRLLRAAEIYYQFGSNYGSILEEAANKAKGLSKDSLHSTTLLAGKVLQDHQTKLNELSEKINTLKEKGENLTADEKSELEKLSNDYLKAQVDLDAYLTMPSRLLSLASTEDSEFKDITGALLDLSLDENGLQVLAERIKNMYQKAIDSKMILSDDSEFYALLDEIRKRYLNGASVERRMLNYFDGIATRNTVVSPDGNVDPTAYEELSSRVNKEEAENEWFSESPDEESELKTEITRLVNEFVNNFGRNNRAAINAYNQIISELRNRTNLTEDEITEFLETVLPRFQNLNLIKYIKEVDELRGKVTYSPITSVLKQILFDYNGVQSSIIDLLQSEEQKFANSKSVQDYIIEDPQRLKDLNDVLNIIDLVDALLIGSQDKTNATVNAASNPNHLPELERDDAALLQRDLLVIKSRVKFLIDQSELNQKQTLRAHERIDKNMRAKFLQSLTNPAFVSAFEKVFKYKVGDQDKPINLQEILDEVAPANLDLKNPELLDIATLTDVYVKFEQRVYEELSKTQQFNNPKHLAKDLVSLFGDSVWMGKTTKLSDKPDEVIEDFDKLNYLLAICSVPSNAFYTKYKSVTTRPEFKFAPIFGQEFAIRTAMSAMANRDLYNFAIDEMMANAKFNGDDNQKEYLKALSRLKNFYFVNGGAGTGKSTGIAYTIKEMVSDFDGVEVIALAPKKEQAENLQKSLGVDKMYTKQQLMELIHKGNPPKDYYMSKNKHYYRKLSKTYDSDIFAADSKMKLLVVDEITLFTEAELYELSTWAQKNNIFLLGLGDPKQNQELVNVTLVYDEKEKKYKELDSSRKEPSGIEDCIMWKSPMLTASLRNGNAAKVANFNEMDSALFNVYQKYSENRTMNQDDLDGLTPSQISMQYYQKGNVIYGDKLVDDSTDLIKEAAKYRGIPGGVAIICDDVSKYQSINGNGITVVDYESMQGGEFGAIFVDVDFGSRSTGSKYLKLRSLYTVTQRSRVFSMIKRDNIETGGFKIVDNTASNPELGYEVLLNPGQINTFKELKRKALETVVEDNGFENYFKKSTIPATVPQAAPVSNPAPNDQPTGSPTPSNPTSNPTPIAGDSSSNGSQPPVAKPLSPGVISKPQSPNPESPKSNGKSTPITTNNSKIQAYLYSTTFSQDQDKNSHSLMNVLRKIKPDINFRNIRNGFYLDFIEKVASKMRQNQWFIEKKPMDFEQVFASELRDIRDTFGNDIAEEFVKYFNVQPELYVVDFNGDEKLVVARFCVNDDYIEVPVITVKTKFTGKYSGKFYLVPGQDGGDFKITYSDNVGENEFITIAEFKRRYPGVHVFTDVGVIAFDPSDEERIRNASNEEISEGSKGFLLNGPNGHTNNGHVVIIATDEVGSMDRNPFKTNGNQVISPRDSGYAFAHKSLNISQVLAYVNAIEQGRIGESDVSSFIINGVWEDEQNPITIKGKDWGSLPAIGTDAFYSTVNGRKWQILPINRGQKLSARLISMEAQGVGLNGLQLYMIQTVEHENKNSQINFESHGVVLTGKDGKSIYVVQNDGIQNGERRFDGYLVYDYDPITESISGDPTSYATFNIADILSGHGIELEEASLKRIVHYKNGDVQTKNITVNDQLFVLLGNLVPNNDTNRNLLRTIDNLLTEDEQFKYGIFMDDEASSDSINGTRNMMQGSRWFTRFEGDIDSYVIRVGDVQYKSYTIDESLISSDNTSSNDPDTEEQRKKEELIKRQNTLNEYRGVINEISSVLSGMNGLDYLNKYDDSSILEVSAKMSSTEFKRQLVNRINFINKTTKNSWVKSALQIDSAGNVKRIQITDKHGWLNAISEGIGENPTFIEDHLDETRKYAIFSVSLQEGQSIKLVEKVNGKYEVIDFDSYTTFKPIVDLYLSNPQLYSPVSDYIQSLIHSDTSGELGVEAYNVLSSPEYEDMRNLIETHLMDRLSKNEC